VCLCLSLSVCDSQCLCVDSLSVCMSVSLYVSMCVCVSQLRLAGMHQNGKPEYRRQLGFNRFPGLASIIGAVDPSMILQKDPIGMVGMGHDFMDALSDFGIMMG